MKNIAKVKEARERGRKGRLPKGTAAKSTSITVWASPALKDAYAKFCAEDNVAVGSRLRAHMVKDLGWKE